MTQPRQIIPTRRAALGMALLVPVALAAPALLGSAGRALAREPEVYAERGVAIDGSDPVAYFAGDGPVAGSEAITLDWKGATWRFADAANRALFAADPEAYAPQYGGYCAFAAANGYVASTVPVAWTLHGGKLYLNFSRGVRRRWLRDIEANIAAGDANWPGVLG